MEQTTLQQRIEERSKMKLLKELYEIGQKEKEVSDFLAEKLYPRKLNVRQLYNSYARNYEYDLLDDFAKNVFDNLLPDYIANMTDEILRKIDEIDYLVSSNKELQEDLP